MKLFLLSLLGIFSLGSAAMAEMEIYCPETKELVYYYKYDEIEGGTAVLASDFRPANDIIPQPINGERLVCPGTDIPLNGWEYESWKNGLPMPKFFYYTISLMTKDKEGNFIWVPYLPDLGIN